MFRTPFFTTPSVSIYQTVEGSVLTGKDTGLGKDIELSLEVVGRLGDIWVLEEDERKSRGLVDRLVSSLRSTFLVAESKPSMRGVEETGGSTSLFGSLGLETSDIVTLSSDTGNDGDSIVDRLDKGLDDEDLLFLCRESSLTGVTKDDETLDTFNVDEPRADSLNSLVVDGHVLVEWSDLINGQLKVTKKS
jgi:hypothetical protein